MRARWVVLGCALAGACASKGSLVVVEVDAASQLDGLATLALVASVGGAERRFDVTSPRATIPPAVSIGIEVPPSVTGSMHVEVTARDAAGTTLGVASGEVAIVIDGVARLPLTLRGDGTGDLAVPSDLLGTDILATENDLAPQNDLTPLPDLLAPALVFLPSVKDFLALNEGSASSPFQFTVQNNGASATGPIQAPTLTGPDAAQFTIDNNTCLAGLVLTVNATCTVSVSFHPTGAGLRAATLAVTDGSKSGSAALSGRAVGIVGRACDGAADCQNGQCVDGYCCNSATCTGCNACNVATKEGTCSPVPIGQDPRSFCTQPCADKCDGSGSCRPASAGTICQTEACSNLSPSTFQWTTTASGIRRCDGNALTCPTNSAPCAGSLACDTANGTCKASCSKDADCLHGTWCNGGSCASAKFAGQPCSGRLECVSWACNGTCQQCATSQDCNSSPLVCANSGGVVQCFYCGSFSCSGSGWGNTCRTDSRGDNLCSCDSSADCPDTAPTCGVINGINQCQCKTGFSGGCKPYQVCVNAGANGECRLRSGSTCVLASTCASGVCTNGTCQ